VAIVAVLVGTTQLAGRAQSLAFQAIAFTNGRWFNGTSFDDRAVTYSVNGRFTSSRPPRVDEAIDLGEMWVIPPFGEAHNHNLGTGVEEWDRKAAAQYLADGVFYVKIQGNVPLSADSRRRLPINRPDAIDVAFANGSLTSTGGHPSALTSVLVAAQGYFPGYTPESLKDLRYFTIDSADDLESKWPRILGQRSDFIKTLLLFSEEFERRRDDSAETAKGLDPRLLPQIVAKAHAANLRVSTHVNTATDFHYAVAAGTDEIVHLPPLRGRKPGDEAEAPLSIEDVAIAARRGLTVVTTLSLALNVPDATRVPWRERQVASLRLLDEYGVPIAIGSDTPGDSSLQEALYVHDLGVLDNLSLLKSWTETTARTIFPQRQIGALREAYEASFLALEGNPLEDFANVRRIRWRFKQGHLLTP
jgi:imidazolonepropionase-like amidohydrolase